jgi:preprotein translocase subunit SecF
MSAGTATLDELSGTGSSGRAGGFRRLYYGQTKFDFVRRRRIWFAISGIIILAGALSLATRGLNYSIEFVGGTSWQVSANGVTVDQAKTALTPYGLGSATITTLGSKGSADLQVQAKISKVQGAVNATEQNKIASVLAKLTHTSPSAVSIEAVGPTWGSQITHKAVEALIVFVIMIAAYISIFFEWKMALAAIVAVIHDILVTVGVYSLLYFLVTPDTVVAFLTVLGYSLYDTIVVFDRIRDNTKGLGATGKLSFTDVVNLSMNQTLARSINTSLVAILPILSVLVLGADVLGATTLEYFGLALLIGLTSGAYSSIFIASPLVAVMKEREPRYATIRQRLEARNVGIQLISAAGAAAGVLDDREDRATGRRQKRGRAQPQQRGPLRPGAVRPVETSAQANGSEPDDGYDQAEDEDEVEQAPTAVVVPATRSTAKRPPPAANRPRPPAGRPRASSAQSRSGPPRPRKKKRR